MELARFDLNLLKTLLALAEERSVVRAASRLHVTPSAVSHALARLRQALGDPLFVRSGPEMVPTPVCGRMIAALRPVVGNLASVLAEPGRTPLETFDPASDRRELRLVLPGALELTLLPALVMFLRAEAPGWTLSVAGFQRRSYEADLRTGEVDLVFSVGGHTPHGEDLAAGVIWTDRLVAMCGPAGPLIGRTTATFEEVVSLPQVYPVPWPRTQNYVDIHLARGGRQRNIVLSLPGYAGLGAALQGSDLVAMLPDRTAAAAQRVCPDLTIVPVQPVVETPLTFETTARFAGSPEGTWLIARLMAVAAAIPRGILSR